MNPVCLMLDKEWKCNVSFFHLSQRCIGTTFEANAIFVIYCLRPPLHLLTQTTDVWHNPTVSATDTRWWERESVTVCSCLIDNVIIRGICSLFVSELPLCSSDPYDTSSGSLQLISIKPMAAQPNYSHPASSDRSQDSAIVNGEVMHTQMFNTSQMY